MKLTWRTAIGVVTLILVFCLDRMMKWWALNMLPDTGLWLFKDMAGFVLERNRGISYSIAFPETLLMILLILIIMVLVYFAVIAYCRREWIIVFPLILIILGAFSNALDRMKYGYVVDFITLTSWPVFNISDVLILFGAVWLIVRVMRSPAIK